MTEAIKNGKDPFVDEKAGKASKGGNAAASTGAAGDSSSVSADGSESLEMEWMELSEQLE